LEPPAFVKKGHPDRPLDPQQGLDQKTVGQKLNDFFTVNIPGKRHGENKKHAIRHDKLLAMT